MPVLIVAILSLLVFVAVMVVLFFAALAENRQMRRIHFDPSACPFTLSLSDAFDPDHAVLWTTQIPVLELINAAGARGISYERIFRLYAAAARSYPELYDGSSFAEWLLFLQQSDLIAMGSHRVKITGHGREFLRCCVAGIPVAA